MGLFGRTSCNEQRNWRVEVVFNNGNLTLTEQLNEKEAKEFYDKLLAEIEKNKSGFIEVHKDRGEYTDKDFFINLDNVEFFRLATD